MSSFDWHARHPDRKWGEKWHGEHGAKKRAELERRAAKMRAYNLSHGSGCAARRRAIERRQG